MRSSALLVALVAAASVPIAAQYRLAAPGYHFQFPRDHFDHPDYQTEWWYYTGNLRTRDGRRLGFELTFFRQGVSRSLPAGASPWAVRDLYLAHFALSDLDAGRFLHEERVNRAGPGIAGTDEAAGTIWNGNWSARLHTPGQTTAADAKGGGVPTGNLGVRLRAVAERFDIDLALESKKPPVVHGINGVSQKGAGAGQASHYVSLTRLEVAGAVALDGVRREVEGSAWMDHEFFTTGDGGVLGGWDWTGLQLDDGTELMVYRLRRPGGTIEPFSAATIVSRDGTATHLAARQFAMTPAGGTWTSPDTHAVYPVSWHISVPSRSLELDIATPLPSQELAGRGLTPTYWEGAVVANGTRGGARIGGVGYLEMTGYDKPLTIGMRTPGSEPQVLPFPAD